MDISRIPVGDNPPWDINVIIEVPVGGAPIKYEMDKDSGALYVDRIMHTAMRYPCNYGFIPHTLSDDGDPADVLVVARSQFIPGCVVRVRPIGVLLMEDESGKDEKILAVPVDKLFPFYKGVTSYTELPDIVTMQISHFFEHYKDLEDGKWVRVHRWGEADEAADMIVEAIERYRTAA
ncbi:MAG: inorganic diphosphatase [Sphingomonadales bacterium]